MTFLYVPLLAARHPPGGRSLLRFVHSESCTNRSVISRYSSGSIISLLSKGVAGVNISLLSCYFDVSRSIISLFREIPHGPGNSTPQKRDYACVKPSQVQNLSTEIGRIVSYVLEVGLDREHLLVIHCLLVFCIPFNLCVLRIVASLFIVCLAICYMFWWSP